jgi:xanthosine utilization system XapX-like protein
MRATVALSKAQRFALIESCIPLALVAVVVGGYVVMALSGVVPHPPLLVYGLLAVIIALVGYQAAQVLRDLASGIAVVEEDVLVGAWRASGPSSDLYGRFTRLGTLSLKHKAASLPPVQERYVVTYSPASKTVWELQAAEQRL